MLCMSQLQLKIGHMHQKTILWSILFFLFLVLSLFFNSKQFNPGFIFPTWSTFLKVLEATENVELNMLCANSTNTVFVLMMQCCMFNCRSWMSCGIKGSLTAQLYLNFILRPQSYLIFMQYFPQCNSKGKPLFILKDLQFQSLMVVERTIHSVQRSLGREQPELTQDTSCYSNNKNQ